MIDLHCHLLPGIDDGAVDLDDALAMARMAVDDGIEVIACTPHIYPGMYENDGPGIWRAVSALQAALDAAAIPLRLTAGADAHLTPNMVAGLKSGHIPTLNNSRYFLLEPPHHVAPPRLEESVFDIMAAGYHPVITHPERLTWIESHYEVMLRLARAGAWMQLTTGSVTGRFGRRPRYWSERMLDEGLVHLLSTDAHNQRNRAPKMSSARDAVAERLGEQAATDMVLTRPLAILENRSPASAPPLVGAPQPEPSALLTRLFRVAHTR